MKVTKESVARLKRARALLAKTGVWCTGNYTYEDDKGKRHHCAVGALQAVGPAGSIKQCRNLLLAEANKPENRYLATAVRRGYRDMLDNTEKFPCVENWNDAQRSAKSVLRGFDLAIKSGQKILQQQKRA